MRSGIPQPRVIWGVGLNYRDHADETGRPLPDVPTLFVKSPSSVIADGDPIVIPPHVTQPDYEGELAVVIGERASRRFRRRRARCRRGRHHRARCLVA